MRKGRKITVQESIWEDPADNKMPCSRCMHDGFCQAYVRLVTAAKESLPINGFGAPGGKLTPIVRVVDCDWFKGDVA